MPLSQCGIATNQPHGQRAIEVSFTVLLACSLRYVMLFIITGQIIQQAFNVGQNKSFNSSIVPLLLRPYIVPMLKKFLDEVHEQGRSQIQ